MTTLSKIFHPSSFARAIDDVHYAAHSRLFRPNYFDLLIVLQNLEGPDDLLPAAYQWTVLRPFIIFLKSLDVDGFNILFNTNEDALTTVQKRQKNIIEEVAETLLQLNHEFKTDKSAFKDLRAFQAVVSSIYIEVLNIRINALVAERSLPPLVKWGYKKGPYTYHKDQTHFVGIKVGIVSLPAHNRIGGLLAWSSLGHEVAGHNFLHAFDSDVPNDNLVSDIKSIIKENFPESTMTNYWCACAEEISCDILGALSMGPSFGIGLIGYLRGIRSGKLASSGSFHSADEPGRSSLILDKIGGKQIFIDELSDAVKLENTEGVFGSCDSLNVTYQQFNSKRKHHLDILRPFVISQVIRLFDSDMLDWAKVIESEASKDFENKEVTLLQLDVTSDQKQIKSVAMPQDLVIVEAQKVAKVIAKSAIKRLDEQSLMDIFKWTEEDNRLVIQIMQVINDPKSESLLKLKSREKTRKYYARHIVAASVLQAVQKDANIDMVFEKMKKFLSQVYDDVIPEYLSEYSSTS